MVYHYSKTIDGTMDEAVAKVTVALKTAGFGVLTDIDIQKTLKEKIGVDFRPYRILGACNPNFAHQVLEVDNKVGVFLPCNVVVQDAGNGKVEISAVDPVVNMQVIENPALESFGVQVRDLLQKAVDSVV